MVLSGPIASCRSGMATCDDYVRCPAPTLVENNSGQLFLGLVARSDQILEPMSVAKLNENTELITFPCDNVKSCTAIMRHGQLTGHLLARSPKASPCGTFFLHVCLTHLLPDAPARARDFFASLAMSHSKRTNSRNLDSRHTQARHGSGFPPLTQCLG